MSGGAWPFLVGGVICLVDSDNERDLNLLNRKFDRGNMGEGGFVLWLRLLSILLDPFLIILAFLEGLTALRSSRKLEAITGLWCPWMFWAARALHWLKQKVYPWPIGLGNLIKFSRDGDRALQLWLSNEEFLVSAIHQIALITSLPFVHTARRSYRLNDPVKYWENWRACSLCSNFTKPYCLEEGEVVTRSP